ncbi:hypothetical protein KF840_05990 [bacterium]|nr:hypothetical protein [bacterium]
MGARASRIVTARARVAMAIACAALAATAATRASAFTPFSGVASNVPIASLDGWSICYQDNYNNSGTPLSSILASCSGDHLMLACRPVGSPTLTLAAYAPRADVIFDTSTSNTPHDANGVGWYFSSTYSWGFAPQGSPINRNSCDTIDSNSYPGGATDGDRRICFHTDGGGIDAGWRCGRDDFLQGSSAFERVILQYSCDYDGALTGLEECDDGNNVNGDGCSNCLIDPCYECSGAPSSCAPQASGSICADDGEPCTSDVCDGAGTCTHPALLPGSPCPDDGSLCTADQCDGAGTCAHPNAVDCDALNQCFAPGTFTCDPQTAACQTCPAGYTSGGGGCQKTYPIDVSLLDNLAASCFAGNRYNSCSGAFGFHWVDAGDAGVGAVLGADLRIEAGISCSGTARNVALNGNPVGSYAAAGTCSCNSPHAPRLLTGIDVTSYVKGGSNAILTDDPGTCDGLSDDGSGAYAVVTVTYAALPALPLPDGTNCDDGAFCNGSDTCSAGNCDVHAGDPCPGPDGDTNCAESCDETADNCTAPDPAGSLCRPASGDCDLAEVCDGVSATCPADAKEPDGTSCDDASVCTQSDTCQGGLCTGADPLDCDDGDACTADSCAPLSGCVNDDAPAGGCLTSGKSIVLIKSSSDHGKDKLLWKWIKGAALDPLALADPTSSTGYALCVYAGTANALIADAALPPGPTWSAVGTKGYKFKGASPDGLSLALLKGGSAGKSKALAKGKGSALPDPTLPLTYPVTVQLKKDGSSLCLESVFTGADEKKNTATQFKAKQ